MGDGVGAGLPCRLDLALGDQRPCDRRAEQVVLLVDRVGAEHGEAVLLGELAAEVLDDELVGRRT